MYGSVFGQWTEISPHRAYDIMGWIGLSITSYILVFGLGVWSAKVYESFGSWFDGIVDYFIHKFRSQSAVAPVAPAPSDSGNAQDTESPPAAMPKARPPMPPRTMPPKPMSTPTLYEDSSHRYHWDPSCVHLQQARSVCPLEGCSQCTDPTTFLRENCLYRTVKGEKYHKRNCTHVRFKLPGSTLHAPTARGMLPCTCVAEMLEECLRSGSWNSWNNM